MRDHLSARGWLLENHSSGIEERMRVGHLEEYSEERSFGIEAVSELQERCLSEAHWGYFLGGEVLLEGGDQF